MTALAQALTREMALSRKFYASGDLETAFAHLERAHVLGQRFFTTHMWTHWWMFKVGIRRMDAREAFGQATRMFAVVPGYAFGWVPKGNTGGANVSPVKRMSPPADLAPLLEDYSVWSDVVRRSSLIAVAVMAVAALELLGLY